MDLNCRALSGKSAVGVEIIIRSIFICDYKRWGLILSYRETIKNIGAAIHLTTDEELAELQKSHKFSNYIDEEVRFSNTAEGFLRIAKLLVDLDYKG
jgi:hypothetical protein